MVLYAKDLSKDLKEKLFGKKRHKYNAQSVELDGIKFDSLKEAKFYEELKMRKRVGDIHDFKVKPRFTLQPGFKLNKKSIRPIVIIPDFIIYHNNSSHEVVDVKGKATQAWQIKWKMLKYRHKDYTNMYFTVV